MIVHLVSSLRRIEGNLEYLRSIIQTVHDNDSSIAYNWVERVNQKVIAGLGEDNWESIIDQNIEALNRSDGLIIEATRYGFLDGFHTALALQKKKPTLIVSRHPLNERAMSGLHSPYLELHEYETEQQLVEIVSRFMQHYSMPRDSSERIIKITNRLYNYLQLQALKTQATDSDIISELLDKALNQESQ